MNPCADQKNPRIAPGVLSSTSESQSVCVSTPLCLQINEDLTYAERVLRYMRRCCCCWLCDSCTGADPDKQIKKQWDKDVEKGRTNKPNETYLGPKGAGNGAGAGPGRAGASASNGSGPGQQNMYRDPDIRLGDEHSECC